MQVLPVDVTELVKITLAMLIPLIAVLGFTVRFAAKPLVDALGRLRENGASTREIETLSRRVLELEQEVLHLRSEQSASSPALEPGSALRLRR
ncbi:MAG TPA: hypothetical protein VGK85_05950 [Myxococcaceae bacterium]